MRCSVVSIRGRSSEGRVDSFYRFHALHEHDLNRHANVPHFTVQFAVDPIRHVLHYAHRFVIAAFAASIGHRYIVDRAVGHYNETLLHAH